MTAKNMESPDLWWLNSDEEARFPYLYVGHHRPLTIDDQPYEVPWLRSLVDARLSIEKKRFPASFLETWRNSCKNTNVYRSLTLFSNERGGEALLGPLLVDVDICAEHAYAPNHMDYLRDAQEVACRCLDFAAKQWPVGDTDVKAYFSGCKGFNLEIRPRPLGIGGDYSDQLRLSEERLDEVIGALQGVHGKTTHNTANPKETVFIDRVYGTWRDIRLKHRYVRLSGSINQIRSTSGDTARRKIALSPKELWDTSIETVVERSAVRPTPMLC